MSALQAVAPTAVAPQPVPVPAPRDEVPVAPADVVLVDPALLTSAASDQPGVTIVLPLARAARAAGVPAGDVLPVDTGPDTAATEIVLDGTADRGADPAGAPTLPEHPLLDPRLARVAEALDDLVEEAEPERPVAVTRESA